MQKQKKDFVATFLLEFTRQLIKNSKKDSLGSEMRIPKEIIKLRETYNKKQKDLFLKKEKQLSRQRLTVPRQTFSQGVQNTRQLPMKIKLNLGKLNSLLEDSLTYAVECDGPNIPLEIITGDGNKKAIQMILTREEIDNILNVFSQASKIPLTEGVYKAMTNNLVILAIVSEIVGIKFVIRKFFPGEKINNF
ncbi:hypothetical protein ACFLZF_00595 [Nanoarchaeota archaeon]